MIPQRPSAPHRLSAECSLVTGDPECRCGDDVESLTDQQALDRARAMFVWQQRAHPAGRAAARKGLDTLLAHARACRPGALVADLLRFGIVLRLVGADPADEPEVAALLAEYADLVDADGDPREHCELAVLRAHRTVTFGHGENALVDTAAALTLLSDIAVPTAGSDVAETRRAYSRTLNCLVLVLLKLGSHELADEISQQAIAVSELDGTPMERLVHQLNRVRLQLSWALRLERSGRDAAARFAVAAETAHVAARLWAPAHGRPPGDGPAAVEECAIIGGAFALLSPGPEHLDRLGRLRQKVFFADDRIVHTIATARCHLTTGRPADAATELVALRDEPGGASSEPVLSLALHREIARIDAITRGMSAQPDALRRYAAALEDELWSLREARLTALRSHSEHHRLAREHGQVTAQALQDPLTGLPNRRALDLRLAEAAASPASRPCAVALIDLDGFKDVNDVRSHAAGDTVLREVATCLRATLRGQDMVARYGGDEFVVVMPTTPLPVARAALARVADAVAALPADVAAGVTTSVGVVPLDADPAAALAAADAAMYAAKRAGGNTVVSGAAPADSLRRA